MLLDLDRFKQVNDTLGHPAGDALLKQVAERLLKIVGDKEMVSRLGGDEFQIILPDQEDRGKLGDVAREIIANLSQPYSVEGSRCIIGASRSEEHTSELQSLMRISYAVFCLKKKKQLSTQTEVLQTNNDTTPLNMQ